MSGSMRHAQLLRSLSHNTDAWMFHAGQAWLSKERSSWRVRLQTLWGQWLGGRRPPLGQGLKMKGLGSVQRL